MGIEFTGLDRSTQERLQQQVDAMAAEPSEPSKNVQGAVLVRSSLSRSFDISA